MYCHSILETAVSLLKGGFQVEHISCNVLASGNYDKVLIKFFKVVEIKNTKIVAQTQNLNLRSNFGHYLKVSAAFNFFLKICNLISLLIVLSYII